MSGSRPVCYFRVDSSDDDEGLFPCPGFDIEFDSSALVSGALGSGVALSLAVGVISLPDAAGSGGAGAASAAGARGADGDADGIVELAGDGLSCALQLASASRTAAPAAYERNAYGMVGLQGWMVVQWCLGDATCAPGATPNRA
jgi:hypothetical protein